MSEPDTFGRRLHLQDVTLRRRILVELGRRRMVGGQEDMIVDVALDLARGDEVGDSSRTGAHHGS